MSSWWLLGGAGGLASPNTTGSADEDNSIKNLGKLYFSPSAGSRLDVAALFFCKLTRLDNLLMWKLSEDELTSRLPSNRESALLNFTKTRINSFIKWDLIKFFYLNAYTMNTVENIARYIGRNKDAVERELTDLVDDDILEKRVLGDKPVYVLTTQTTIRPLVDLFVLACEDRIFRIKTTDQIIQKMRQMAL